MFLLHHKGTVEGPETLKLLELEGVRVCVSLFYEAILDLIRDLVLCFFP